MDDDCETPVKEIFQEPQKKFYLRSRKRRNSDAVSISSMDTSITSEANKKKRRRRIAKVASSIFSSSISTSSKLGNVLHRSFSSQADSPDVSIVGDETDLNVSRKKMRRSSERISNVTIRSWIVDIAERDVNLSRSEIKRQEAIYELYCGEDVLLHELRVLRDLYYEPLLSTSIFTINELRTLFGDISDLIVIHTKLRDELLEIRDQSGFTEAVGSTIVNWLPNLTDSYVERCRSQVWARHLLEEKKANNKRFQEFMKKRLDSPRSVDLWTYLDVPRSRIVKYPLLVNEILRHTPSDHDDQASLKRASSILSELLRKIDRAMGDAECKLAQSRINYHSDYDPTKCIEDATELITEGQLKDVRGTKLHCFLFDTCFVLTRPVKKLGRKYNLFFPIIPSDRIEITTDEKIQPKGFKIGNHFLMTEDEHAKRHWIDSFNRINRLVAEVVTEKKICNSKEKENKDVNHVSPRLKRSKGKSIGSLYDSNFSVTLRKSLLRHKRNSIDYI